MHGIQIPFSLATLATLSKNEIAAVRIAAESGCVITKELAENRGITTRTASTVLKRLVERNLLTWYGSSPRPTAVLRNHSEIFFAAIS